MGEEVKSPKKNEPQPEEQKEVTPEWVKNLQESLDSLPDRIKEALTPDLPDPDPDKPVEIPAPQPLPVEEPPQPEEVLQEKPKKKSFLDFLL